MVRIIKFCMAGFGNVGVRFAELLIEKKEELARDYGIEMKLTGVCTRSKGALIDRGGLALEKVLEMNGRLGRFDENDTAFRRAGALEMIETAGAELFLELTTLSIGDGEPASGYIRAALTHGMDVITANKGPEAWHFKELNALAEKAGRSYLFETAVMDGTPVFNFAKYTLRGCRINAVRGILNGTSNFVLRRLEQGCSFDEAIKEAQRLKMAEADPSMDIDGWDGAAKICSLANVLMDAGLTPRDAEVKSIRPVTARDIEEAKSKGLRIKYVCSAWRENGKVTLSVKPQMLPADDMLSRVDGPSAAVTFFTDLAGEVTVYQKDATILQTAYGVYSDLLTLAATDSSKL